MAEPAPAAQAEAPADTEPAPVTREVRACPPPPPPAAQQPQMRVLDAAVRLKGTVVHGFGRGSKLLGIPTANLDAAALGDVVEALDTGIYAGWASVNGGPLHKTVASVGWNPFFNNEHKTVEPHIIHDFPEDFYGHELRVLLVAFLRPEANFSSLEALVDAIHADIAQASEELEKPPLRGADVAGHEVFQGPVAAPVDLGPRPSPGGGDGSVGEAVPEAGAGSAEA